MKIVIAPDSFKESLSASAVADAIEKGFRSVFSNIDILKIPMADGGEGTVDALVNVTGGRLIKKLVTGPLGNPVEASFGIIGDGKTAVIEIAAASGIQLVPSEKRNPLLATTRGTGELILAAMDEGVSKIIIGLGGSATNDGGIGMAKALGIRFLDEKGEEIPEGGGNLTKLASIDLSNIDPRLKNITFEAACDVVNPLIGENGASAIFGPQKGANPEMVEQLDKNLTHFANKIAEKLGKEIAFIPGSGAAGGVGASLIAFLDGKLKKGVEIILEITKFDELVRDADLVITGEGKFDSQTIFGKTPIGVAKIAKKYNKPVIGIAGILSNDSDVLYDYGIDALFSTVPGIISIQDALKNASENIERVAKNIAIMYRIGKFG